MVVSFGCCGFRAGIVLFLAIVLVQKGGAIKCWECNSKYDSRCGDAFANYSVALVDCDQRQGLVRHLDPPENATEVGKATLCRKTAQLVEGEVRIIRGCGWVENDGYLRDRDCFNRAGTKEVQIIHCVCSHDACNESSSLKTATLASLIAAVVFASRLIISQ